MRLGATPLGSAALGLLLVPLQADAQQPSRLPTIGLLAQGAAANATQGRDAFVADGLPPTPPPEEGLPL